MTFSQRSRRLVPPAAALAAIALAAAPAFAADHAVSLVDKTFDPAVITVSVGDTVTWTVTKAIDELHSVTSGKPGENQGAEFESGIVLKDNGQTFQFTFTRAGTFDYFCQVHAAEMTGVVTVVAAGASPATSEPAASVPPASEAPVASAAPGSAAPGASESPAASEVPSMEHSEPVPVENRVIGAGILIVTLVVLFAAAALWRRVNPA